MTILPLNRVFRTGAALLFLLLPLSPALAQPATPRYGVGFEALLNPSQVQISRNLLGIGIRGRVSIPVNQEVSFGFGTGVVGFVLGGHEEASYVINPQLSVIVTLPADDVRAPYFLGGVGGYFATGAQLDGGPTLHIGAGWIRVLSESTIFAEVNPSLIILAERAVFVLPLRIGVIM